MWDGNSPFNDSPHCISFYFDAECCGLVCISWTRILQRYRKFRCHHINSTFISSVGTNIGSKKYLRGCRKHVRKLKLKVIPQQAEVAQGVPGSLKPQIFLTFGTTRAVGRQPYAPAAFTPGEIPGTHFQGLSGLQGTWLCRGEPRKKSSVIPPGIDPGTL